MKWQTWIRRPYGFLIASLGIACMLLRPLPATAASAQDVLLAERNLCDAIIAHDAGRTESSLMPDFTLSLVSGGVLGKDEFLRLLNASSASIVVAQARGQQVHFYGQSTAIVTGLLEELIRGGDGAQFDVTVPYTDVWISDGQHWRQAAAGGFFWPQALTAGQSV